MKTQNIFRNTKSVLGKFFTLALIAVLSAAMTACGSDDDDDPKPTPTPTQTGTVNLNYTHVWGPSGSNSPELQLNNEMTHPGTGDTITITKFKYYVSNVRLQKDGGGEWVEPESYRIADVKDSPLVTLAVGNVPAGNYTGMNFIVGVDEERNYSGAQDGALSPTNGMFWDWNTGYIFLKVEGDSPHQAGNSPGFAYHVGGFEGDKNAIRTVNVSFSNTLTVSNNGTSNIDMYVNTARVWHGGLRVEDMGHIHMPGSKAVQVADNFQNAFLLDGVN